MNEKMLKLLEWDAKSYPHELEKKYSRVLNQIIELWYTPKAEAYFQELMVDKRGGRQGFPQNVAAEIFRLSMVHERTCAIAKPNTSDAWEFAGTHDKGWDINSNSSENQNFLYTPQQFIKSIEAGDCAAVGRFITRGSDLDTRDERGWPPLMVAAFNGNEEMCRLLIKNSADVNAKDKAGYVPLHWAAFNGHSKVVKLLIDNQSDPNTTSNFGWTPIMQAATRGHLAAIKNLIAAGGEVNLVTKDGWTALLKATANGHSEVVKLLLNEGADRNIQHPDGSTPLSIATKIKNEKLIALLKAAD